MLTYFCRTCKTEFIPDQARERGYTCPDCASILLSRGAAPTTVAAVPPAVPATAPAPAATPNRTLDNLRTDLQRQLAARRPAPDSATPPTGPTVPPVQPSTSPAAPSSSPASAASLVLPPLENEKDAATMEQMLATLGELPGPVTFEIAGDAKERKLILRGEPATLRRAKQQLHGAYGRADVEDLPPHDDPALMPGAVWAATQLRPAREEFLPLKTWLEFKEQEPLCALLAGFSGLAEGEAALSQVIVRGPAPAQWAAPHLQQLVALQRKGYAAELPAPKKNFAGLLGASVCFLLLLGAAAWAFIDYWPRVLIAMPLCLGLGYLGLRLLKLAQNPWTTSLDKAAEEKLHESALQVELRLFAAAGTAQRAQEILNQLLGVYRLFDTVSGNYLSAAPLPATARPEDFTAPARDRGPLRPAILSIKETAGLWHLPVLAALELVKHQTYERVLPRPDDVSDPQGAPIGQACKGDRTIPVRLSRAALNANIFVVGMTQMGKSNLMGQIATHLAGQADRTLIVVDPHGDLVHRLAGLMPPERLDDVLYLDFTDPERSAGINLLDVADGIDPSTIAENFVDIGRALWADFWGPRMLVPLTNTLRALAHANLQRPPERQFTILSLAALLTCDAETRAAFLDKEVPEALAPTVHRYFRGQFNDSSSSFREQVLSPVLSKASAFERSPIILRLIGQSRSTVRLFSAIQHHKIILVNTASGVLGADLSGFLGSMFVNMMRLVIARQEQLPREQRVRVSLIADEFQTMEGVDWGALLGELQKFGGSFILGTQALGNLLSEQTNKALVESIFAGAATTIALRTNGADAFYLTKHQLGAEILRPASLMDLPRGVAYIKSVDAQGRAIPAYTVNIAALPAPDADALQQVLARRPAYTVSAAEADRLYRQSLAMLDEYGRPGQKTPDYLRAVEAAEKSSNSTAPATPNSAQTQEQVTITPTRALRGVEVPPERQGRAAAYAQAPTGPMPPAATDINAPRPAPAAQVLAPSQPERPAATGPVILRPTVTPAATPPETSADGANPAEVLGKPHQNGIVSGPKSQLKGKPA